MEHLLHYLWKHKIFPLQELRTTDGQRVEVIDTGLPNADAGPDFFNAKLKLDGVLWVGNVEIHDQASQWMKHGHQTDEAYDNVILHVVSQADCTVCRRDGSPIPQLVLTCPDDVARRYDELRRADVYPPCYTILSSLPRLTVHSWLSALQVERFERKARDIRARLDACQNHWEDVFFITLARNYGFGLNSDAFEAWAKRLPFRAVDKHRDDLFQVEAFFFGQAGLLDEEPADADDYYLRLQKEFRYLQRKFELPPSLPAGQWRFLRLRPGNFPHVRLAQLACLYHTHRSLFSQVMEAETPEAAKKLLSTATSAYWEQHFTFRRTSPKKEKRQEKQKPSNAPRFETAEELQAAVDDYFDKAEEGGEIVSEQGLARHLGVTMTAMRQWYDGKRWEYLQETMQFAYDRMIDTLMQLLRTCEKNMVPFVIFMLKQVRFGGYQDRIDSKPDLTVNVKMGAGMEESDFK